MKALLLAGYQEAFAASLQDDNGRPFIDRQIEALRSLPYELAVVLAGDEADDILRASRRLWGCELVYDTSGPEASLWTNLKAGLYTTNDWVIALPAHIPSPSKQHWNSLVQEIYTNPEIHQIRMGSFPGPMALTRSGRNLLKSNDINNLDDKAFSIKKISSEPSANPQKMVEKIQNSPKSTGFPLA